MSSRAVVPLLVGMMLLTGVCNTLLTKYQDMQCVANCDAPVSQQRQFEQPVLQTLQMFIGESGSWLVVLVSALLRRRKTSSDPAREPLLGDRSQEVEGEIDPTNVVAKPLVAPDEHGRVPLTGWKILLLAIPSCCDIAGTTLMNVGLLFVAASIYQMTRGALVLFVGLFSVIFLKRRLGAWKWASLFIVVTGVALVGMAGYLERKWASDPENVLSILGKVSSLPKEHTALEAVAGILMIAGAQIFTATQFVVEESIMEKFSMEPIIVVGWEGVFGVIVTLLLTLILHLAVGMTEAGQGGYFDARQGFYEVFHHRAIAVTSVLIMISIGGFNFFGLSVTRNISATARSTIDTCRTLFIWLISLGLGWETFKWLQVPGFALLVYGTMLFNDIIAPPTARFVRGRISERQEA